MKKRNNESKTAKGRANENAAGTDKKTDKKDNKADTQLNDELEIDNQGFSDWLRSSDGFDMMRLFVIANSILVFVTMGWPKVQEAIAMLGEYFYD
ncbi:exit protein of rhodopsin and TRP A [Lasioglossum baleicum]|uniref:exit protein of rhodopsin and TRP A n=1 Tax=Lasioglossum baleicum TaxID=434251 RepID=UPI003FCEADB5